MAARREFQLKENQNTQNLTIQFRTVLLCRPLLPPSLSFNLFFACNLSFTWRADVGSLKIRPSEVSSCVGFQSVGWWVHSSFASIWKTPREAPVGLSLLNHAYKPPSCRISRRFIDQALDEESHDFWREPSVVSWETCGIRSWGVCTKWPSDLVPDNNLLTMF